MKSKDRSNFIKDDKGAVMLSVIVAFMLLSVLVVAIMSLVVMNFRMKAMDRRSKDEFYYVEKSLNDVYAGIGKECAKELGNTYSSVLSGSYKEYTDDALAYEAFHKAYVKRLVELFYSDDSGRINLNNKLNKYLTAEAKGRALVNNTVDPSNPDTYIEVKFIDSNGVPNDPPDISRYKDYKEIIIKDVYVSSAAGSDYKSSITTDIVITIPEVSLLKVNENELDYALVGCKGLVFNGSADIKGNVYGGVDKESSSSKFNTGGINVYKETSGVKVPEVTLKSNYVVSAGDINVNDGSLKITNGYTTNDNEIWTENIIVGRKDKTEDKDSTVEIAGNTYVLNDLQIEGKNKTVTFKGNYYGYGDGNNTSLSPKESNFKPKENGDSYYDDVTRSKSSSIIVNATDSTVNLAELDNLVLLGQAYIDHNSKSDAIDPNTPQVDNKTEAKLSKDETGMAGAIKASQEILLVPEEFLTVSSPDGNISSSNPVRITAQATDFIVDNNALNNWIRENFNKDSNGNYVDNVKLKSGAPTRTVKLKKGSMYYAYCYFQFDDSSSENEEKYRSAYIDKILNCNTNASSSGSEPTLQTLKRRIIAAAQSQNSQIITDDSKNVYAKNGGVISYKNTDASGNDIKIVNNKNDLAGYSDMVDNANRKYRNLATYLDFNSNFKRAVTSEDYEDVNYPFGRVWWIDGIKNDAGTGTIRYDYNDCRVIVNGNPNRTLKLGTYLTNNPMSDDQKLGNYSRLIVISDGDIIIDKNIKMIGFIYCNGTVTVVDNKKLYLESDLSMVQKIINEEINDIKDNLPENATESEIDNAYKKGYITRYLLRTDFDNNSKKLIPYYNLNATGNSTSVIGKRRYNISGGQKIDASKLINTDYTSFVQFDNWRKTGAGTR